jgi:hypothetical protein
MPEHSHSHIASKEQILVEWFCDNLSYSKSANRKVNEAIANRLPYVILEKDDISVTGNTHVCDLTRKTITLQATSGILEIPFLMENSQITFRHNGHTLTFPQSEYNKVIYHIKYGQSKFFISMPFYLIDLVKFKQINFFTNYERDIYKKETKMDFSDQGFKGKVKAFYNEKWAQLIYSFKDADACMLGEAVGKMKNYIEKHRNMETMPIKEIR